MEQPIYILVVEDDNEINQLLCNVVKNSGYNAQPAYSGTEAILYLDKQDWDMILLDLMLPGLMGEEVLALLGERTPTIPVIIISAKLEQQTKVTALRNGADDYITKPFDIEEVSARIDSLLRRNKQNAILRPTIELLKHKEMTINTETKSVTINETELTLTAREYAILVLLMSSPKKVFTKANLFESVWNEDFRGDDNTINVHISNLRSKIAKVNPNEEYIETIWGMGYRLKI